MQQEATTTTKTAFTPPASVTAATGGTSPQMSTTDADLTAMYGKEAGATTVTTPTKTEGNPDAKEKTTEVKTEAKADENVGGYKDDSAAEGAGYKEPEAKSDTKDSKADADSKEASKVEFDKTGHSEEAVKVIEGFAEANKLSKEQTAQFAGFVKSLQDAQAQAAEKAKSDAKIAFQNDFNTLKNHKDFGGENLDSSFKQVAQVLDLMPDVKKYLTDTGTRLQPQIMISLKSLHGKLFGQEGTIVQGGANKSGAARDPWDEFYNK